MFGSYNSQAREFSHVPFWFWNDELSEAGIARQLDDFQAHGVHAFVIHPRAGLPRHLGWMSDALLGYMRFAIEEAERRGMWIILYDEGMYPSGSSSGQVVAENPAYACRGLVQVDLTTSTVGEVIQGVRVGASGVELTDKHTLVAVVTRQHDQHQVAIVDTPIGSTIRGVHFVEEDPQRREDHKEVAENHPPAGDLLNPQAMQCFIRHVYQGYYDAFGRHFGKTIKAIFTDEPGLLGRGTGFRCNPRPGTTGILDHVNEFLGYDFTPHLPALWSDAEPDARRHRDAYARAIRARLEETYYQPISAWCEDHGVALTGHPAESEDIGMLRYFQIPGQDVVWRYIEPGKETAIAGPHSTMAKCASSAMLHLGRRRNINEFAGAYGHSLTYAEYRWLALWLLIRGCNMLSPHAFYYSVRGPRGDERPRDVGPNSPWWDRYTAFAEMTGKLCWLNTDSEHVCSIAILGQDNRLPWKSARVCFENQIDFNYIEDRHFCKDAVVAEDGIRLGAMHYELLVVENGYGSTAGQAADEAIARLGAAGRIVSWNPEDGAIAMLNAIGQKGQPPISVIPPCAGLRIRRVRKEGYAYCIVFNEGETAFHGQVQIQGARPGTQMDMDTGGTASWSPVDNLGIAPHGCLVLAWDMSSDVSNEVKVEAGKGVSNAEPGILPGLIYHPEGDAIVVRNGTRWDNRPLYCNGRKMVIMAGEMPGLSCELGKLLVGIRRDGVSLQLDQFSERVARYRPGRMEWEVREPNLPGLAITMTATTVAEGDGFTARVQSRGAKPGDELQWIVADAKPETLVSLGEEALGNRTVPLVDVVPHDFAMVGAPEPVLATSAFEAGLARVEKLGRQVVVDTPDPYFNAGIGASCAAMFGLYIEPWFAHGGSAWRVCFTGWRIMDGVTAYGWHDLVANAIKYHGDQQVTGSTNTKAEADPNGSEQSRQSRFHGVGKITTSKRYDMQTQFFDQCCREWRATGDTAMETCLLPMLELHLQWAKDCFDPDGDGLYESYINTWPTDSVWYNGGGSVEESAYIYYQRRTAAEMCRRAGRSVEAVKHDAEADSIQAAIDRILWLKDKGQYAAYIDQGGHKRVHDDAWVYSQHLPIEAGLATPLQAWQAMYYTDWAMEKYRFPYGGEMRQTSNWVPQMWSTRELYHGDNFAMALGYYLAGQGDDGWELLRGAMLESMYGDPIPKNGYSTDKEKSPGSNYISPGGLSQPCCSIDFADITSMFCRTVVEGLFGYRPDYPNGVVVVAPGFPSAWDHASINTTDYSLAFKRDGAVDRYTAGLKRSAKMRFRLPVRADTVESVTVNGEAANWKIEPWAGVGMLMLEVPESVKAEIVLSLAGREPQAAPIRIEKKVGESNAIANAVDPQGCLDAGAKPGQHMAFAKVERGNVPYLQVYKVLVSDPEGDARRAAKLLRKPPPNAKWTRIPLEGVFNGDVRTIFQQKYLSPRPATVSCRIGYDGWSAWTFYPWKIPTPEIKLGQPGELVTTSQGVPFGKIGAEHNIAFTSRWDNWPKVVMAPVNVSGEAVWVLVCGSTNPMQGRIANAVLRFIYADGREEQLELVPPLNFLSLCGFGRTDYDLKRDAFALSKEPPPQVQLGENCRAMVYGWKLRPGVVLKAVSLETLSEEVVIGLMGVSMMNPRL